MRKRRLFWFICAVLGGLALLLLTGAALRRTASAQHARAPHAPLDVVINEVAWMGTAASANDEWIELHNTSGDDLNLDGWTLRDGGDVSITLGGVISAGGYYLLERTDDNTVSDVPADLIYTGNLENGGETLTLRDAANAIIDTVNGEGGDWPAGYSDGRYTMERVDPSASGDDANWASNDGLTCNGLDANGALLNGTPAARNSAYALPPQPQANLDLAKTGPPSVAPGGVLTYVLRLHNSGELTATSVYLTDALPAALDFITQTSALGFSRSGQRLSWTVGDLPPGAPPLFITLTARLASALVPDAITNLVSATRASSGTLRYVYTASHTARVVVPAAPLDVVINEVAWMGTSASASDEWLELYNPTDDDLDLAGWTLSDGGDLHVALSGVISAGGYYLLERGSDDVITDALANQTYAGILSNNGETLVLRDASGATIDQANGDGGAWPAGNGAARRTMERVAPYAPDSENNWLTNDGVTRNGHDVLGNPINGTPLARNSAYLPPLADLVARKSGPGVAAPGSAVTYTLYLSNTGLLTASAARLSDTLPPALAFIAQTSVFSFERQGQELHWALGDLPPGAPPLCITLTARLSATAWGSVVNVLSASSASSESNSANNVARWTLEAVGESAVLLNQVYYDGYQLGDGDEAVQLLNVSAAPAQLAGWRLGNADRSAALPPYTLAPGGALWIAQDRASFAASFGYPPDLDSEDLDGAWPGFANGSGQGQDEVLLYDAAGALADALVYELGDAGAGGWIGPAVQPYPIGASIGQILCRVRDEHSGQPLTDTHSASDWAQYPGDHAQGRRVRYPGWDDFLFWPLTATESASLTLALAPDAAYDLLYQAITQAHSSILAASYTFEHARLAELLADKAAQGLSVTVLLEGEPSGGLDHQERWACQQIETAGGQCWFMHTYSQDEIYDRYDHMHAKYLVIDGAWALVGTENLNPTGLPDDDKSDGTLGRRGVYLLTDAPSVVERLSAIFAADLDPAQHNDVFRWQNAPYLSDSDAPTYTFGLPPLGFTPVYTSGGSTYPAPFAVPLELTGQFYFELFTAPEAALRQSDALLGLVRRAGPGDELCVEMLYERAHWGVQGQDTPASAPNLRLQAYVEAARRGARVRILLDRRFDDAAQSWSNAATVDYVRQVARDEGLDLQARLGDPTGGGVHNKMLLARVDGVGVVHLGSLNGSEASNKINRELALQVTSDAAFTYLKSVFDWDWNASEFIYLPLLLRNYEPPEPPVGYPLISEALYNPPGAEDGGEWVEIYNPTPNEVHLAGWLLGDVGPAGEYGSGLYAFPAGARLPAGGVLLVARQAADASGFTPDFEFLIDPLRDDPAVPNMTPAGSWDGFGFALSNAGDEVLLLDASAAPVDALVYGTGSYPGVLPHPGVSTSNHSLERRPAIYDTDDCRQDFFDRYPPDPGQVSVDLTH